MKLINTLRDLQHFPLIETCIEIAQDNVSFITFYSSEILVGKKSRWILKDGDITLGDGGSGGSRCRCCGGKWCPISVF